MPAKPSALHLTRDYLDSSLRAVTRDLMQHMTRSIGASEKRLTTRLVRIEDRLVVVETKVEALLSEEVLQHRIRKLAANLVRELAAQGIRLDPAKLTE